MEGRNEDDYTSIFTYIRDTLNLKPNTSMSDYEYAMRNALKNVFVEKVGRNEYRAIKIGGCVFHFAQVSL